MDIVDLDLRQLREAPWNPNQMDGATLARLMESIKRYDIVHNLVVRLIGNHVYEVISGNQRLAILREAGYSRAPCVVVDLDDAGARVLAQALNHIHGQDDLGLRAKLLQDVLKTVPQQVLLAILPETASSLNALASMGKEDIAEHLKRWQQAQAARLKHLQFQLTPDQLGVVEEAIKRVLPQVDRGQSGNPNSRGDALHLICKLFLQRGGRHES